MVLFVHVPKETFPTANFLMASTLGTQFVCAKAKASLSSGRNQCRSLIPFGLGNDGRISMSISKSRGPLDRVTLEEYLQYIDDPREAELRKRYWLPHITDVFPDEEAVPSNFCTKTRFYPEISGSAFLNDIVLFTFVVALSQSGQIPILTLIQI